MSENEIDKIVADAPEVTLSELTSPQPLRRPLPDEKPYPVQLLGKAMEKVARAIHNKVQAPMSMCAQAVLATASLAVQAHANVELPTGQIRPVSEFFLAIADSGERKTSVDEEAMRGVIAYEDELREVYNTKQPLFKLAHEDYKIRQFEALREKKKEAKKLKLVAVDGKQLEEVAQDIGLEPREPLPPMITCPEPTYEGMCKLYEAGLPSLGIYSDEGGQFLGGHGMKEDNRLRSITGISDMWGGKHIKRVRSGDGAKVIANRRLSVNLMMQHEVAQLMLSDPLLKDQGILSRFLTVAPESAAGKRLKDGFDPADEDSVKAFAQHVLRILRVPHPLSAGGNGELAPRTIRLNPQAKARLLEFAKENELQLGEDGHYNPIKAFGNKMMEHATRLAAIKTLFADLNAEVVALHEVEEAIGLVKYYAEELLRLNEASFVDNDILLAEKTLKYIHRLEDPYVSLPDIYQFGPSRIKTAENAKKIVGILVKHGWLVPVDEGMKIKGRMRKEVWRRVDV